MPVPPSFLDVVLIWATTPLAITLITRLLTLLLGQEANGEVLTARAWAGSAVILVGLACFEWGDRWERPLRAL